MAKRGKKKKKTIDINVAVVALVVISILLMILIYTKSGYIGENLSPLLGGIMGFIKYVIPIGTFLIISIAKLGPDITAILSVLIYFLTTSSTNKQVSCSIPLPAFWLHRAGKPEAVDDERLRIQRVSFPVPFSEKNILLP